MNINQYILQKPNEDRIISKINITIPSSNKEKIIKKSESSLGRRKASLLIICEIRKKLYLSIVRYKSTNISLY